MFISYKHSWNLACDYELDTTFISFDKKPIYKK